MDPLAARFKTRFESNVLMKGYFLLKREYIILYLENLL